MRSSKLAVSEEGICTFRCEFTSFLLSSFPFTLYDVVSNFIACKTTEFCHRNAFTSVATMTIAMLL